MRAPKNQQASVPCPGPQDGSSANGWLSDSMSQSPAQSWVLGSRLNAEGTETDKEGHDGSLNPSQWYRANRSTESADSVITNRISGSSPEDVPCCRAKVAHQERCTWKHLGCHRPHGSLPSHHCDCDFSINVQTSQWQGEPLTTNKCCLVSFSEMPANGGEQPY